MKPNILFDIQHLWCNELKHRGFNVAIQHQRFCCRRICCLSYWWKPSNPFSYYKFYLDRYEKRQHELEDEENTGRHVTRYFCLAFRRLQSGDDQINQNGFTVEVILIQSKLQRYRLPDAHPLSSVNLFYHARQPVAHGKVKRSAQGIYLFLLIRWWKIEGDG